MPWPRPRARTGVGRDSTAGESCQLRALEDAGNCGPAAQGTGHNAGFGWGVGRDSDGVAVPAAAHIARVDCQGDIGKRLLQ